MSITIEAKRVKAGQNLSDLYAQAIRSINVLKGIKVNLAALKTTVDSDGDFIEEDSTEVQTMIDALQTELGTI